MNFSLRMLASALLVGIGACGGGGGPAATPNAAPTAYFNSKCVDLRCAFENKSSDRDIGDSLTSNWAFGDGTSVSVAGGASRTYASAGTYNVTLTTTDSRGAAASFVSQVTVTAPPAPAAPHANFTVACATPLQCTFTDVSTYDAGSVFQSRSWDFGDNTAGSATSPAVHQYGVSAFTTFTAKLTVTDTAGKVSTSTRSLSAAPTATTLNCEGSVSGGAGCVLTLTQAATVTATIVSSSCGARDNKFLITAPITATLFADGCFNGINTPVSLSGGTAFAANTALQFAMVSGLTANSGLAFAPSIRVTGDFANGWILTFDDGAGGIGEPDFNDIVVRIKATP